MLDIFRVVMAMVVMLVVATGTHAVEEEKVVRLGQRIVSYPGPNTKSEVVLLGCHPESQEVTISHRYQPVTQYGYAETVRLKERHGSVGIRIPSGGRRHELLIRIALLRFDSIDCSGTFRIIDEPK